MTHIGILHPGAMGTFFARSAQNSGNTLTWVSKSRSLQTRACTEFYRRVAKFKNAPTTPSLDDVLDALINS